jgi:hypothetical protein
MIRPVYTRLLKQLQEAGSFCEGIREIPCVVCNLVLITAFTTALSLS